MTACAIGVSMRYGRRFPLAVTFTVFSPIYLMFTVGYDEVYPMVAGPFVAFLFWIFSRPLEERDGAAIGVWLGGLTVSYLPFVFPAATIGLGVILLKPRKAVRLVAAGMATLVTGIVLFWPPGVEDFFRTLGMDLNLGDKHTLFARYHGQASGPNSIFFDWRYAISSEHIADLTYMWFWSGSLVAIIAATIVAFVLARRQRETAESVLSTDGARSIDGGTRCRVWLALALLMQQVLWALFLIPKLGPRWDLDLFFSAYLVGPMLVGFVLDRVWKDKDQRVDRSLIVGMAYAGAACAALIVLTLVGIPPAYS
jgi:hypothetical protein